MVATALNNFWDFNLGHLLTILALLVSFWTAHRANVKRAEDSAKDFEHVRVKVDLIFRWFENNVVGKGERSREMSTGMPTPFDEPDEGGTGLGMGG